MLQVRAMATPLRRGHGEGSVYRDAASGGWLTLPVMTLFLSGFAGPRLLGEDFVRSGA